MPPPIEPAMTTASKKNREMPIPWAPKGGNANFDRKVAPISGAARSAKRTPFAATGLPAAFDLATVGATTPSPIDHGAEQRNVGRLELRLDAHDIVQPGVMALDREDGAARARRDQLR